MEIIIVKLIMHTYIYIYIYIKDFLNLIARRVFIFIRISLELSQPAMPAITCSLLIIKTLEVGKKYVHS